MCILTRIIKVEMINSVTINKTVLFPHFIGYSYTPYAIFFPQKYIILYNKYAIINRLIRKEK